ncbi:MAG: hypothetical protein KJ970_17860 [Candidatus Eisenbacteria bacterium]|uniref:CHASE2 domain-containing protein n=1 Tax=Eiseniibacteriota bacterium TaxID=2212470 RepID=A0A948S0V1_UNCEI|nr:hypothetical protein [Candidatus Eisenbacteria bacterium]MBU1950824.1 hypothetical protein [Candidatus Eisenbacteria bacterium]MBU2692787.1 hypothetical protein [Candidatus Eisenbacteria bacterium]
MADLHSSKHWYDYLLGIDRRWVYAVMAIAVIIPAIKSFDVPVGISSEVRNVFEYVDGLKPGDVILLGVDYEPSTLAELHPMSEAILSQAFEKDVKVILTTLSQFGPAMADEIITRIAHEYGKEHGVDYTFLGYKPYPAITILAMGTDFRVPFPTDYYGTEIDSIPMMQDLHNYDDVECVISIASGNSADFWIQYGNAKYGVQVALGVTGVMATDYYPYLQSKQLFGLIPGIKGAAEYETLRGKKGDASRAMPYQVTSHIAILLFMIVANIGYVTQRRAQHRAGMMR